MRTFVIAEAGSCHDARLDKALRLVAVAKGCGADAVKFQYWSSGNEMARRRRAYDYEGVYLKYQMPTAWLAKLKRAADAVGIEFMCSTYCPQDVAVVAPFVDKFKIASFEANDPLLLGAHVDHLAAHKQVIVSMGMGASYETVYDHLTGPAFAKGGFRHDLKLLHCVSAYPTPHAQLNLARLHHEQFDGFSDHSEPSVEWSGALAVAAGATIIERHFRDKRGDHTNPDYPHAMNPNAFQRYVEHIRWAEPAVGEGTSVPREVEKAMLGYRVR